MDNVGDTDSGESSTAELLEYLEESSQVSVSYIGGVGKDLGAAEVLG